MKKLMIMMIAALSVILLIAVPARTETTSLSGQKICLDPGHGGSDPGAVNEDYNLQEKDINLDVAYGLKALLEADGAEVVMTRTDDSSKSNNDRYTFCNNEQATILVSVHTNSTSDPTVDGSLALYFHKDDKILAQAIYDVIYPYLRDTAPDPSNFTDFGLDRFASGVLLKSDMPAAMMEPLFMSNPPEAELLVTPIYLDNGVTLNPDCVDCRRAQIAQAIHDGILAYFAPAEPTPTPEPGASMHVASIDLSLSQRGKNTQATAAVKVVDANGNPVSDATVTGDWFLNGMLFKNGASGTTGSDGVATISSGPIKNAQSGDVVQFCVTDVSHASLIYDPTANTETCDQINLP